MTTHRGSLRAALVAFALAHGIAAAQTTGFKAGFAERDITPKIGMEAPGGYGKAYHQTVHDPCKVRASVFDDGKNRVALVGIDALGIRGDTVAEVRAEIEKRTGIPGGSILIGASHSHSSGPCCWILPGEFDHASELVRDLVYKQSTIVDLEYLKTFKRAIIDAVVAADTARTEALGAVGSGKQEGVAFNRRFKMKNGITYTHPGLGNPEIVEPAGPVDPEVGVIGVWDAAHPDELLGCVVNFSCHATTNPGGISANYIYYLEKVIQGFYGKEAVVVFLNGASGDVTQVDNQSPHVYPSGDRWARIVGGKVGAEALEVLISMEPGKLSPMNASRHVWTIPRRRPSAATLEKSRKLIAEDRAKVDSTDWTFAKETLILESLLEKEPAATVEVQAVQVGPAVFVTTPAEYFCRLGLDIKAGSGFPFTFPVSLANGCVGYVPDEDAFSPTGGGYETRLTSYSNLEITAGTAMRDMGISLARKLTPGANPGPKPRPKFQGKPWPYGSLPPQRD
ncbi:MAG: hypothetical protein SFX72_22295 [Isosphaeraceae bacterium]|nr:hypothetical protein [Isosphaeraceae bacterium]